MKATTVFPSHLKIYINCLFCQTYSLVFSQWPIQLKGHYNCTTLQQNMFLYYAFRLHELLLQIALGPHAVDIKFIINEYPPISTLRWLTTAERLCGLYIRTQYPSEELKWLIKFISQCYAAAHLDAFLEPELEHAAYHFWRFVQRSRVNVYFYQVRSDFNIHGT